MLHVNVRIPQFPLCAGLHELYLQPVWGPAPAIQTPHGGWPGLLPSQPTCELEGDFPIPGNISNFGVLEVAWQRLSPQPPRDVRILISKTCERYLVWQKGFVAKGLKGRVLRHEMIRAGGISQQRKPAAARNRAPSEALLEGEVKDWQLRNTDGP